jgi:endonuclease/exonuclease/phosphatase family metal-dependent hydrolase
MRYRLVSAALLAPIALRLLGTFAILSGPWSLIAGVCSPVLGLVAVGLGAWAWWRLQPRWLFALLAALNLGIAFEDFRLPLQHAASGVSVLTWNVALGFSDQHRCVQSALAASGAEVLLLQEIRKAGLDGIATALAKTCTWVGYFNAPGANGLGLCVPKSWTIKLAQQRPFSRRLRYAYLFAELHRPGGKPINIMNIHLQSPELSRQQEKTTATAKILAHTTARQIWQLFEVLRVAQELSDPLLIGGDFNSTPNTCVHQQLRSGFVDAHRSHGSGIGATRLIGSFFPVRIDYFYASKELVWSGPTRSLDHQGCSDHNPVLAYITLP